MKIVLTFVICLFYSISACASHISIRSKSQHFNSEKFVRIVGLIKDNYTAALVGEQIIKTTMLPGDRIVVINSPGGSVSEGDEIVQMLEQEKAANGNKIVCVVDGIAMSMGFNILSHCDVRYATERSLLLFHPQFVIELSGQLNPVNLRKIADELELRDRPYKEANMKALHMGEKEYDINANKETVWHASTLLKRGFLKELVKIDYQ